MAVVFIMAIIFACNKEETRQDYYQVEKLPVDTGGVYMAKPLGSTDAPYGYYVYTPSYYTEIDDVVFPLLIFLHGVGETGNSQENPEILDDILIHGPPKLIDKNKWNPTKPMVVVSPQCHEGWWNADKLKDFVEYILKNYKINVRRIYVTGLSMGGMGTFSYIGTYGDSAWVAAAVPICGSGTLNQAGNFYKTPIWAFHGDADFTVPHQGSMDMVEEINRYHPMVDAKVTIYPGVGHDSWTRTYDGTGMGDESEDYAPFNQDIIDWMLQYERTDLDTLIRYFSDCGCPN